MQPFFSIIIPVYNVENYILECVDSVLSQSLSEYEIILIDDGSTDKSKLICDQLEKKHETISTYHKENGGLSSARNLGIDKAKGIYLVFLDSDDILIHSDALKRLKEILNTGVDLLLTVPYEFDINGTINHDYAELDMERGVIYDGSEAVDSLYRANDIWVTMVQTKVVRRTFCKQKSLIFMNGIFHEDDEWIARLLLAYPTVQISNEVFYGYRHRSDSIISSTSDEKTFKKTCDRIIVAHSMLTNVRARESQEYQKYAAKYYLRALSDYHTMSNKQKRGFLRFLKKYDDIHSSMFKIKSFKLKMCSVILKIAGPLPIIYCMNK